MLGVLRVLNKTKREEFIDLYRGIGVILMVMGHMKFMYEPDGAGQAFFGAFNHYIHAFHMPMFFFLSGFCHRKSSISIGPLIIKQAKKLLVPYLAFGIVQYIMWRLYIGNSIDPLINLVWVNTDGLAIAGAIWFLTALFFVILFYAMIERFIENVYIQSLIVIVISLIGCLFPRITSMRLPYAIDVAFVGLGFYFLGYVLKNNKDRNIVSRMMNPNIIVLIILSIINVSLIMYNNSVNMRTAKYEFIPLFWFNAVLAIIIGMRLCMLICDKVSNPLAKHFVNVISEIGVNGLIYVCINQLTITICSRLLAKLFDQKVVYNILLVIFTFAILELVIVFKEKIVIRIK